MPREVQQEQQGNIHSFQSFEYVLAVSIWTLGQARATFIYQLPSLQKIRKYFTGSRSTLDISNRRTLRYARPVRRAGHGTDLSSSFYCQSYSHVQGYCHQICSFSFRAQVSPPQLCVLGFTFPRRVNFLCFVLQEGKAGKSTLRGSRRERAKPCLMPWNTL